MTENDMIEELAKTMCGFPAETDCKECWKDTDHICGAIRAAKSVWNAGYRKIPDGAVVLNIGENNEALDEKTIEFFVKHNAKVRKEMAREIIDRIDTLLDNSTAETAGTNLVYLSHFLKKEYGVEVEE